MTASRASSSKAARKGKMPAVDKPVTRTASRKRAAPPPDTDDEGSDFDDAVDEDPSYDSEQSRKKSGKKSSSDTWLEDEASRRNPHVPLTKEQRRALGRTAGRGLIPWTRPHMNDKLLLILNYELARHQIEVPWDEIAHRLHPGSSSGAINQHLNRVRLDLAGKGHMVPPAIPKTNGSGFSSDPTIRGYMREDDEDTGNVRLVPAKYNKVWEDRRVNLPDGFDATQKLLAAEKSSREPSKKKKRSRTTNHSSSTETAESSSASVNARRSGGRTMSTRSRSRSQIEVDPAELNSDSEYEPRATKRRSARKASSSKRTAVMLEVQDSNDSDEDNEEEEDKTSVATDEADEQSTIQSGSDDEGAGSGLPAGNGQANSSSPRGVATPETDSGSKGSNAGNGSSIDSSKGLADALGLNAFPGSVLRRNPMLSAAVSGGSTEAHYIDPSTSEGTHGSSSSGGDSLKGTPEIKMDFNDYLDNSYTNYFSSQYDGQSSSRSESQSTVTLEDTHPIPFSGGNILPLPRPTISPYLQQGPSQAHEGYPGPSLSGHYEQYDGPAFHPAFYHKAQPMLHESPGDMYHDHQTTPVYPGSGNEVTPGAYHYEQVARADEEDM